MSDITVKTCPVMEAIAKKLSGFDMVDRAEQTRMISRAAKAGAGAAKSNNAILIQEFTDRITGIAHAIDDEETLIMCCEDAIKWAKGLKP
jgi:hypothetical protein